MVAPLVDPHPLHVAVTELHALLDRMPTGAWAGLEPELVRTLMRELARAGARIDAHKLAGAKLLEDSGAAKKAGATSTGDLLASDFGGDRFQGNRLVRTARALERASTTQAELEAGRVSTDQARVIGDAIGALPETITAEQRRLAERAMIDDASRLSLKDLRRRAQRLPDVYAPTETTDAFENEQLRAREAHARGKTRFWMRDNADGTWTGEFTIPEAEADMLRTALDAIATPRRAHLDHENPVFETHTPSRMGLAFAELIAHLPADELPAGGGTGAVVIVNLDHDTLVGGLKAASLSTGTRISAGEARKLACRVGLMAQVLGGDSLPLDLGRSQRLFSKTQRLALAHRDGGCSFPGCDRPPGWCEAHHHVESWATGGPTDLANGALLCPHHHRLVHEPGWRIRTNPATGCVEVMRPGRDVWERNQRWRAEDAAVCRSSHEPRRTRPVTATMPRMTG